MKPARRSPSDVAAPRFSVVVPTYNEREDIHATIGALQRQSYPAHEIIVVDGGSSDGTELELRRLERAGAITAIFEGRRRGVAAARNTGIRRASGDVLLILNADVQPDPSFLKRLATHYRAGADVVRVEAAVSNVDRVIPRFLEAQHRHLYGGCANVGWTEGFSVRRHVALDAGLFPEAIPGAGGEDGIFYERVAAITDRNVVDPTIVVRHVAPASLREFWRQWYGRGRSIPFVETGPREFSRAAMLTRRVLAAAATLVRVACLEPLWYALRLGAHSAGGFADVPAFATLRCIQLAAHRLGEAAGIVALVSADGRAR